MDEKMLFDAEQYENTGRKLEMETSFDTSFRNFVNTEIIRSPRAEEEIKDKK